MKQCTMTLTEHPGHEGGCILDDRATAFGCVNNHVEDTDDKAATNIGSGSSGGLNIRRES